MKLFEGMFVKDNQLYIRGVGVNELKNKYSTPLHIYDENMIENRCREFINNFKSDNFNTEVLYASKAFSCLEILRLVDREKLGIDVVSLGEMYTAYKANVNMKKVYFHGNNKTPEELEFAIKIGVGTIIVDNDYEHNIINELGKKYNKVIDILLRINTGIDAHTHEYIKTAKDDSKFGYSVYDNNIYNFISELNKKDNLNFLGFHSHIGSQIFEKNSFFEAAKIVMEFSKDIETKLGISISVLNLGGGFGIYYTEEDTPFEFCEFLKEYIEVIEKYKLTYNLNIEKIIIEPGRSLINNAGSTLYTIGGTKKTFSGREYIFIDGGMADNPRYALYQAKYEAAVANNMISNDKKIYTVAGKCCESGDVLIKDIELPRVKQNDLLIVASTGAYNFSMSSNYNRLSKLPVVFVKDGSSRVVIQREKLEDLLKNDI